MADGFAFRFNRTIDEDLGTVLLNAVTLIITLLQDRTLDVQGA
jgi:hypothetical protein